MLGFIKKNESLKCGRISSIAQMTNLDSVGHSMIPHDTGTISV